MKTAIVVGLLVFLACCGPRRTCVKFHTAPGVCSAMLYDKRWIQYPCQIETCDQYEVTP